MDVDAQPHVLSWQKLALDLMGYVKRNALWVKGKTTKKTSRRNRF